MPSHEFADGSIGVSDKRDDPAEGGLEEAVRKAEAPHEH
jgi:hypothetical protein